LAFQIDVVASICPLAVARGILHKVSNSKTCGHFCKRKLPPLASMVADHLSAGYNGIGRTLTHQQRHFSLVCRGFSPRTQPFGCLQTHSCPGPKH
jgi:hypothetical protein